MNTPLVPVGNSMASKFIELLELDTPTIQEMENHKLFRCTKEDIKLFQGLGRFEQEAEVGLGVSSSQPVYPVKRAGMGESSAGTGVVSSAGTGIVRETVQRVRRLTLSAVRPSFNTTKSENSISTTASRPLLSVSATSERRKSFHGAEKENLEGGTRLKRKVRNSMGTESFVRVISNVEDGEVRDKQELQNVAAGKKEGIEGKKVTRNSRLSFNGIERGWIAGLGLLSPNRLSKSPSLSPRPRTSLPPSTENPLSNSRDSYSKSTFRHSMIAEDLHWDSISSASDGGDEASSGKSFSILRPRRKAVGMARSMSQPITSDTIPTIIVPPMIHSLSSSVLPANLKGIIESCEESTFPFPTASSFISLAIDPVDLIEEKSNMRRLSKLDLGKLIIEGVGESETELPKLSWSCSSAEERESSEDSEEF